MAYEFKLPDLGEGLTEGEVARWLVAEGDEIAEDAPLVEIQTDKTTVEIPSPAAGTVSRILVAEGDVVPVGTVLVVIGDGDGAGRPASTAVCHKRTVPETRPPAVSGRVQATPLVRRIAQELGVDLATVDADRPGRPRSPRTTCAARPVRSARAPKGAARRCAASGGRSSST